MGAQSFPGFGTDYARVTTTSPTVFSVGGLGAHTGLHVSFDLAFIDSWDGFDASNGFGPDIPTVDIQGVAPLSLTWIGGGGNGPLFGPGTVVGTGNFGVSSYSDAVVHYDVLIADASDDWKLKITAGGAGWQGGDDESWGIDNFHLAAIGGAVPEPSTWALMIGGFGLAGVALRRRRAAVAA
ncbi:PEPxxWA-CTERM sorting domain-containing protein [Phenylobacterium sp.]|uniref:PEPxxWA-CTERM sorting domain-containing protein n=1 Tax=Phenylobacterium sp. TaxID=1871053 RepID=UPI0025D6041A|nr:PEPxxWA-CTERM sorting domain-containing protein [Phenylobacterium sp.]